jgi:hypothetical protein
MERQAAKRPKSLRRNELAIDCRAGYMTWFSGMAAMGAES